MADLYDRYERGKRRRCLEIKGQKGRGGGKKVFLNPHSLKEKGRGKGEGIARNLEKKRYYCLNVPPEDEQKRENPL